jgi:hypothetical protein
VYEKIVEYFLNKPARLIELGGFVSSIGIVLISAGLLGRIGIIGTTAITTLGSHGNAVAEKTLAEIYPTLPTWWIPETLGGGLLAIVIFVLGAWIILVGKKFKRFMEH